MRYFTIMLALLFTFSVIGAESCPLENVKYKPLKESISVLLKNVKLEPGCEAQAETLKDASQNLSDIVANSDVDTTTTDADRMTQLTQTTDVAINQTTTAINSISSINSVLRGKCGKKLMNTFDYMEALTDTVVGLGPLLLLQEGNTSLVLYTTVAGQVIKGLIDFLRGKKFDMSKQETREQFIKNSCSFYSLNNKVRALLYTLNTQSEIIEGQIEQEKKNLAQLKRNKPEEPQHPLLSTESTFKSQKKEFSRFLKMLTKIRSKKFICLNVKRSITKGFGTDVVATLESILDSSEDSSDIRVFTKFFISEINLASVYTGDKCDERAQEWIASITDLQTLTSERIETKKKELDTFVPYIALKKWEQEVKSSNDKIKKLTTQKSSLAAMTSNGHNIDLSEILDNRDKIKLALFENKSWRTKSATHSWLEYKIEQSHKSLKLFIKKEKAFKKEILKNMNERIAEDTRNQLCAQAETLWDSWTTAESHMKAAQTYCGVFRNVIQKSEFKKTYNYCFNKKKAQECDDSFNDITCNRTRSINSVLDQRIELNAHHSEITEILNTLDELQCEKPAFFSL